MLGGSDSEELIDMPVFPSFKYLKPLIGQKRVLDVGCGTGRYLEYFSRNSVGLELSAAAATVCKRKGLKVIVCDANKGLPVGNQSFEVVFASHLVEHLESPLHFLKEANRVAAWGGFVILGFPIEKSLARIIGDHYFNEHPGHLYSFSIDGTKRLLEKAGLHLERVFVDISLVGRFPILNPLLGLANRLPLSLVLWFSNAVWITSKKLKL